jgi:glutaminyl-tRNA synthetase
MRLDDTNPSKEDKEYVDSILDDVKWIQEGMYDPAKGQPWDGPVRKTSDYFDTIYECAKSLILSGDAYVDSLTAEEMKEYRGTLTEPGKDSPYRTRSIEENLELFEGMREGKFQEGSYVVRAKIDMQSPNINMRDPTLYRIKHESHQETGDKWCIYPMYDFSHPIADALEEITHSLCTLEFEDHRPFYDWTIEKLIPTGLLHARPQQIEFSRLNIQNTVLSKRKLIQLVQEGHVDGWDDPRMPTLSGMRRRGVPPAALRVFCERVGISKSDSNIDYGVLEECIREVMDENCARAFCVLDPIKVTLSNWASESETFTVDRHPKKQAMGSRNIPFSGTVYIERSDFFDADGPEGEKNGGSPPKGFKRLLPGGQVRLRYAYVIQLDEIIRDPATNEPVELKCTYIPETRAGFTPDGMPRVKGIIHWVDAQKAIKCKVNQYDRLFTVEEPGKGSGDFLRDINPQSLEIFDNVYVEPSVAEEANDILRKCANDVSMYPGSLAYQFERSGYFALDKASAVDDSLVFNRVVTLKDTWAVENSETDDGRRKRGQAGTSTEGKSGQAADAPIEDILRVSIRVATITSAEPHPDADGLLVCKVDCGDLADDGTPGEPRTVVAGLAGKIAIEELVGKKVVAVTNLKPAKVRGIESHAMLLAASDAGEGDSEAVELLLVPSTVPNGEFVTFEGKEPSKPDAILKNKGAIKAFERAKAGLRVNAEGEATFVDNGNTFRMLTSDGPVTVSTLKNVAIQ